MAERIKVLFTIGSLAGGGAERQVIQYLRYLDREKFEPILYLQRREGPFVADIPDDVAVHVFEERVNVPRWKLPGYVHRLQSKDLVALVQSEQIDCVFALTIYSILIAGDVLPDLKCPWIASNTADPRRDLKNEIKRFRTVKRWLLKQAFHSATRVLAVSNGDREGVSVCHDVPLDQIHVLHNSVDLEELDRMTGNNPPDYSEDRFHVVTAGRLNHQKGHRYLIEATRRAIDEHGLSRIQVHIYGDGELRSELESQIERLDLTDHVKLPGFTSNPFSAMRAADLFCLPSLYEGFPLILLEALACRVPIVASDCPSGPREVLQAGEYGDLVEPTDIDELTRAIVAVAHDPERLSERTEAGRKFVETNFDAPQIVRQLEQHLIEVSETELH